VAIKSYFRLIVEHNSMVLTSSIMYPSKNTYILY